MAKRRFLAVLVALVLGALGTTGIALADDRRGEPRVHDPEALCDRLEAQIQHVRAAIGTIEAVQERIQAKIDSGELNRRQLARAQHALRHLGARQAGLERRLERLLALHAEHCD